MNDFDAVAFYVVAHLDDWQLFMNPNATQDLTDETVKVVFIHTTGDDAGEEEFFWRAKEEAVIASIKTRLSPLRPLEEVRDTGVFNGHIVHRWSGANAVCYFMRVPDGNGLGTGFPRYGRQSLHRLRLGEIDVATTVDQSTEYVGWQDFVDTLQAIVDAEADGIPSSGIDHPETDELLNPGDHSDHVTTGLALEAMSNYGTTGDSCTSVIASSTTRRICSARTSTGRWPSSPPMTRWSSIWPDTARSEKIRRFISGSACGGQSLALFLDDKLHGFQRYSAIKGIRLRALTIPSTIACDQRSSITRNLSTRASIGPASWSAPDIPNRTVTGSNTPTSTPCHRTNRSHVPRRRGGQPIGCAAPPSVGLGHQMTAAGKGSR